MADSLKSVFLRFGLVSILVFSTIMFVATFQDDNDVSLGSSILSDNRINGTLNQLNATSTTNSQSLNTSQFSYDDEVPERGFGSLLIFSIVTTAKTFVSALTTTYNILIVLPLEVLGVPAAIINVLSTILVVTVVLLSWRVIRAGS